MWSIHWKGSDPSAPALTLMRNHYCCQYITELVPSGSQPPSPGWCSSSDGSGWIALTGPTSYLSRLVLHNIPVLAPLAVPLAAPLAGAPLAPLVGPPLVVLPLAGAPRPLPAGCPFAGAGVLAFSSASFFSCSFFNFSFHHNWSERRFDRFQRMNSILCLHFSNNEFYASASKIL